MSTTNTDVIRIKLEYQLAVGSEEQRIQQAKHQWELLLKSLRFKRCINVRWLDFKDFLRDVGLPPTKDSVFKKRKIYDYYSSNTCYWEERWRKKNSFSYLKGIASTGKS